MIDKEHAELSVRQQCELLGVSRSGLYYRRREEREENRQLKELLVREHLNAPIYGGRKLVKVACRASYKVGRKRVTRLMRELNIKALMPRRRQGLSQGDDQARKYPYLLRGMEITHANQVWTTDITYVRLGKGFVYVTALIDVYSRYIVGWSLSTSLETVFCVETFRRAMVRHGTPEIVNTDQGSQYTSGEYVKALEQAEVRLSMDGKGRVFDNILIERFWRTLKYEEVYLRRYESVRDARESIAEYMAFYNQRRLHQHLGYRTPAEVYEAQESEVAA